MKPDDTYDNHTCHDNCPRIACVLRRELTAMTEQRDELAEALKEIEWSNNSQWQSHCAKKAIQSLTPNAKP